jgi:predicted ribosomally synthesized peptide with nif11-like leader
MSSDKFNLFIQAVNADPALMRRVKELKQPSEIISLASELGHDITAADLQLSASELSPEELESIFGGFGIPDENQQSIPHTHAWCCSPSITVPLN